MWPKFSTNSSKVITLDDYEKGACPLYDPEAIYRPLEVLIETKKKKKALRLCDALVFLFFLTVGYLYLQMNRNQDTVNLDSNLSVEIIGKENVTISPIYYSMIPGDNTKVKVALELSSQMIVDVSGNGFYVQKFTSKSHDVVPTLIWFPPTPSEVYWTMEYVHVNGYLDNEFNVHVEPISVAYACEISTSENGASDSIMLIEFNRTYNVNTTNFSYHTLDDSREPAPWGAEEDEKEENTSLAAEEEEEKKETSVTGQADKEGDEDVKEAGEEPEVEEDKETDEDYAEDEDEDKYDDDGDEEETGENKGEEDEEEQEDVDEYNEGNDNGEEPEPEGKIVAEADSINFPYPDTPFNH